MKSIAIVGATASGKTEIAIKLAKKYNGEIINSDSQIVYRDFNIGTDKPKRDSLTPKKYIVKGVSHHLIDFLSPKKQFSVVLFKKLAEKEIKELDKKGKVPFLVGGSPLYTDAVVYDYDFPKISLDKNLRIRLSKINKEKLLEMLKELSPSSYAQVDKKNKRRIIRAIELGEKDQAVSRRRKKTPKDFLILGIKKDRGIVYRKINKRVDMMIKEGLIKEAKYLLSRYGEKIPAMSGIGYKQLLPYFAGEIKLEEAIENIKKDTRHFAKRQETWFKRDKNIRWARDFREADKICREFFAD